jgi:Flp pilus assembly protein TadD
MIMLDSVLARIQAFARTGLVFAVAGLLPGCAMFSGGSEVAESLSEHREYMAELAAAELAGADQEPKTFDETLESARKFHREGDSSNAMRLYYEAFRLEPDNPRAQEGIAFLQLAEQPARAERVFIKVAADDPESSMAQVGLGLARYAQGDPTGAVAPLARAIELDPDSADAHDSLGVVLADLERYDQAISHSLRARELNPEDAEIANNLGVAYTMSGDLERAETATRDAISLDPEAVSYHNNLGFVLGRQGRYEEALREFRSVGSIQVAQNNIAYLYFVSGRYDEAIGHYEMALLADGDDTPSVLRNLNTALDARSELASTQR